MEQVLAPWFAVADRFAPQWRRHVHGGLGHRVDAAPRPPLHVSRMGEKQDALQMREALELFALAKEFDALAFVSAACRQPKWSVASSQPFDDHEKLRIKIATEINDKTTNNTIAGLEFLQLLLGVHAESSTIKPTEEFVQAKQRLGGCGLSCAGDAGTSPRFDIELELRLLRSVEGYSILSQMHDTIQAIDRTVFHVRHITVVIGSVDYELDTLTQLFQTLHVFHKASSNIDIRLQLPGRSETHQMLYEWKPVFDLIARTQFDVPVPQSDDKPLQRGEWNVYVQCRGTDAVGEDANNGANVLNFIFGHGQTHDFSTTWVVAGCLSALANAGDHVTSVHLERGLEDYEHARLARAKYIGYMLRAGHVEKLTIKEQYLTMEDVDVMTAVFSAPNKEQRYRALFSEYWNGIEDEGNLEDDEAEQFITDKTEVLGLMQDIQPADRDHTDVLLVGYGQCHIEPQFYPMLRAMTRTTAAIPERDACIKSLHLRMVGVGDTGEETGVAMTRLAVLVGETLEELVIEMEQSSMPLISLSYLLDYCPKLRRLEMNGVALASRDDMLRFDTTPIRAPPVLEKLAISVQVNATSAGMQGLCGALKRYGPQLKELRLCGDTNMRALPVVCRAMTEVLRTSLSSLETLHIAKFPMEIFSGLFGTDACGLTQLKTLVIENAAWDSRTWRDSMAVLAMPVHPLAKTLRTLRLCVNDITPVDPEQLLSMLRSNHLLLNVRLVLPVRSVETAKVREAALETHGAGSHEFKAPLPLRNTLALLSSLDKSKLPWEAHSMRKIVDFAALTKTRRVMVSFKK